VTPATTTQSRGLGREAAKWDGMACIALPRLRLQGRLVAATSDRARCGVGLVRAVLSSVNFSRLFSSRVQPNPVADELRSLLVAERMRNDELMRTIVEMRREGFQAPPPQAELSSADYGLPEGVMAAIEQRAPTRQSRERLMQEARKLLRKGDEGEVAEVILQGEGFAW
jgi:hypothetical protein